MTELRLNPGTNPNINPETVEIVYRLCMKSAEFWFPQKRFINLTLHEYIEPTAFANKYPTLAFAEAVKALCVEDYGSVTAAYKANRSSWQKRWICAIFHRKQHQDALRHIGAVGFWHRVCFKCSVAKELNR